MTSVTHELKTWPEPFQSIRDGAKTFEFRRDDRKFRVGDRLWLREYDMHTGYTGRNAFVSVTYVLGGRFGIPDGYVCLSIKLEDEPDSAAKPADAGDVPAHRIAALGRILRRAAEQHEEQAKGSSWEWHTRARTAMLECAWILELLAPPHAASPVEEPIDCGRCGHRAEKSDEAPGAYECPECGVLEADVDAMAMVGNADQVRPNLRPGEGAGVVWKQCLCCQVQASPSR